MGGGPASIKLIRSSGGLKEEPALRKEKPLMLMYDPQSGGFGIREDDLRVSATEQKNFRETKPSVCKGNFHSRK